MLQNVYTMSGYVQREKSNK